MAKKQIMKTSAGYYDSMFCAFSVAYHVNKIMELQSKWKKSYRNKMKVLEVGCYDGRFNEHLKEVMHFVDYTGIDYNDTFLNTKAHKDKRCKWRQCDVTKPNALDGLIPKASQDVIICSEVIEHIEAHDHPAVYQLFWDYLRPGGMLSISFPMNLRDRDFHKLDKEVNLGHVFFPCYEDFMNAMKLFGFELVEYNSGYTIKSDFGVKDRAKMNKDPVYQRFKSVVGAKLARIIYMVYTNEHTGGGYFLFKKPD